MPPHALWRQWRRGWKRGRGSGGAPREVLGLLTGLVDASLVQFDEQDGRGRFRLLEPVRKLHGSAALEDDFSLVELRFGPG